MDYERIFLDHLDLIDQVVRFIVRRHRLSADEAEELTSSVRLKIVDNDYEVLRRFEGRSSLRTYLTVVTERHFLDSRIAKWGKWRPSLQARRLGPVCVLLDRLLTREGLSFDEAAETLRVNYRVTLSRDELYSLSVQLPERSTRRFVGEDSLDDAPAGTPTEAAVLGSIDSGSEAARIERALSAALDKLGCEDRLVLKMLFQDDVQISRIARLLKIDQRRLYSRIQRVKDALRHEIEAHGLDRARVLAALDLDVGLQVSIDGEGAGNADPASVHTENVRAAPSFARPEDRS